MRLRLALGDVGSPGTVAGVMVSDLTSWPLLASSGENLLATSASTGPASLAMRATSCGSRPLEVIVIMLDVCDTSPERPSGAPGGRPSRARRGSLTAGAVRTSRKVARSLACTAYVAFLVPFCDAGSCADR
jgi:hypothetical protein